MKKPSGLAILFNAAAVLIVLASGAAVLRSTFVADEMAPCSTRYDRGTQLALEGDRGRLLTAADLQARSGGTDWGLLQNARIVEVKGDQVRHAVEVKLAKASTDAGARFGMGFTWAPRGVEQTSSACLAYSVLIPAGFDFAGGGRLPGLQAAAGPAKPGSSFHSGWRDGGRLEVRAQLAGSVEPRAVSSTRGDYVLPRGRWVALEQELVLNTPGQKDGAVRVWADGALQFERTGLVFRDSLDVSIDGVTAEAAAYATGSQAGEKKLWFSAPEMRWQ